MFSRWRPPAAPFRRLAALAAALALAAAGCDSSNPVAPPPPADGGGGGGSGGFTVALSVVPSQLVAGDAAAATVTVTATRADGTPAPDGTAAAVNTDMGMLVAGGEPSELVTVTLSGGRATVQFLAPDEVGTANLLAQVGNSIGRLQVEVVEQIPESFFVSGVVPNVGGPAGGELVTVQGDGFEAPLLVAFASAQARVVSVTSATAIVVETPPAVVPVLAGSTLLVDVTVTKDLSAAQPATATLAGAFTYAVSELPPVFLLGVSPAAGPAAGGTAVTISGGGFQAPLRVDFGGAVATVTGISDTAITVLAPPSPQPVAAGATLAVDVTVSNALDVGTQPPVTLSGAFTYQGGMLPPGSELTVASAAPTEGPHQGGTVVTVHGAGFVEPVAVDLGGVRQVGELVIDSSTVEFTTAGVAVESCPGSGVVQVTGLTVTNLSTGAQGTLAGFTFNYRVPRPRISRISPTLGPQLGNTLVNIDGEGFELPLRVVLTAGMEQFAASLTGVSSTRVQVTTPRVPDSIFPEVDCQVDEETAGKRWIDVSVDVTVTNLDTGCTDTFPNGYTYRPTDTSCRPPPP